MALVRLTINTNVTGCHNLSDCICCCCRKSYESIRFLEIGTRSSPWLHRAATWKSNLLWNSHHSILHEIVQPCRPWSVIVLVFIPTWRPVLPPHHYNFLPPCSVQCIDTLSQHSSRIALLGGWRY